VSTAIDIMQWTPTQLANWVEMARTGELGPLVSGEIPDCGCPSHNATKSTPCVRYMARLNRERSGEAS